MTMSGSDWTELTCECDDCGGQEHGGTEDFHTFWARLKAAGWRATKDDETWTHQCPECVEESR